MYPKTGKGGIVEAKSVGEPLSGHSWLWLGIAGVGKENVGKPFYN